MSYCRWQSLLLEVIWDDTLYKLVKINLWQAGVFCEVKGYHKSSSKASASYGRQGSWTVWSQRRISSLLLTDRVHNPKLGHKKEKNFILITDVGKVQQYVQLQPNCTYKLRPTMKFLAIKPCLSCGLNCTSQIEMRTWCDVQPNMVLICTI